MIPVRLSLRNFLSYGENVEPLDFTRFHVACLSGRNGHGKSALLDAITWVLWGQARVASADDLVRLHQNSMEVEFEFDLEGQRYRVTRKRERGRVGQSDLQLQARSEAGVWRALSGQGVRGTQERIAQLLRMDYDTFVNSAFILQGRADEFARKTPGERKRILGEILNLGQYDLLAARARERARDRRNCCVALDGEVLHLETEARCEPERRADVERLDAAEREALLALESLRADLNQARAVQATLEARRRERDDLLRRLSATAGDIERLMAQRAAAERRLGAARALLERTAVVRERHANLVRERETVLRLDQAATAARELEKRRSSLERELQAAAQEIAIRKATAGQSLSELERQQALLPSLECDIAALTEQVERLDDLVEEDGRLRGDLERFAGERAGAEQEVKCKVEELARVAERFDILRRSEASCPVCEGALPSEKRLELGRKVRQERTELESSRTSAVAAEAAARKSIGETRRRVQEIQRQLRAGEPIRARRARTEPQIAQIQAAIVDLDNRRAAAEALDRQLASGDYGHEIRAASAEAQAALEAVGYDEGEHRRAQSAVTALADAERDLHALEGAEQEAPVAEEETRLLAQALAAKEAAVAEDRATLAVAERDLTRSESVDAQVQRLQSAVDAAEARHIGNSRELGGARQALERCLAQVELLNVKRREREQAGRDAANYELLERVFGRNGIQALIIENALPELEREANALLARMTTNEMRLALRTQRETKTAGVAETLEIEISDSLGSRRYEMFSGGEAFRINFALRIALSKLLARRAGARLQTLVIDEGFGSQDSEGRDLLVEAIQSVEDDFARILVITHVDELRESFPTTIEVTKTHLGSQITLV